MGKTRYANSYDPDVLKLLPPKLFRERFDHAEKQLAIYELTDDRGTEAQWRKARAHCRIIDMQRVHLARLRALQTKA